ncbi:MAG: hypothetical protein GY694_02090 [Gammaproteobacteria bacterium]|nr:hypothetical protein [Gammaproteobacteria bacterium]
MKYLPGTFTLAFIFCFLFIGKNALAVPAVEAHMAHYTLQPKSGSSFNRIEQLSIVIFANKLIKEYRSPYTVVYRIKDKEGNIIDGEKKQILFTMCDDASTPVKTVGECGNYNNIAIIKLKTRQTRQPPSTKDYQKVGRYWIKQEEADQFPRFEEMNYKLDSYKLTDRSGKIVNQ